MNKKSFIWNMLGSGIYAAATILFVMFAKRAVGDVGGAQFYMAFTTGQMLLTIGYFEIRPFQSTDVSFAYSEGDYFGFRAITSALMLLGIIPVVLTYAIAKRTPIYGLALIAIVTMYKMMDALSDVFEGEFQRRERMDLSGKSMFLRVLAEMLVFCGVCYLTKDVLLASIAMLVVAVVALVVIDVRWMKQFGSVWPTFDWKKLKSLFQSTVLLFLGSMMCNWIWNGTKYVVDWNFDEHLTMIYGIIFMPTMVINLGSGFLFKPMLTSLAKQYEAKEYNRFMKTVWKLCLGVVGLTIVCLVGAYFLGVPVLGLLYNAELSQYRLHLLLLLVGGGLNALGIIFYYCLTVMRKMKWIFAGYALTLVISFVLPIYLSQTMQLLGTVLSYVIVMGVLLVIHGAMTIWMIRGEARQ